MHRDSTVFLITLYNKNKQITILLIALIIIMFTLNLILIPQFGLKGAAVAVAITFILFNISKSALIYYYFKMNPFGLFFITISAITIITFIGLNNFNFFNSWIDMLFKSIIVTVIFALIILTNQSLHEEKKKLLAFFKLIK